MSLQSAFSSIEHCVIWGMLRGKGRWRNGPSGEGRWLLRFMSLQGYASQKFTRQVHKGLPQTGLGALAQALTEFIARRSHPASLGQIFTFGRALTRRIYFVR